MAMTLEKFDQVKRAAITLVSQIEWADFPEARFGDACDPKNPLWGDRTARALLTKMAGDEEIRGAIRAVLRRSYAWLTAHFDQIPDLCDVVGHAAGMVQSAFKIVIRLYRPDVAAICATPIRVKFSSCSLPYIQGPIAVALPSPERSECGYPIRAAELN